MEAKLIHDEIVYDIEINDKPIFNYEILKIKSCSIAQGDYTNLTISFKNKMKKTVLKKMNDFEIVYTDKNERFTFVSSVLEETNDGYNLNIGYTK